MDETNNNEWVCPVCETVNSGDICVICGEKKRLKTKIMQPSKLSEDKKTTALEDIQKNSEEEAQWVADKWKRMVAIIILLIIAITCAVSVYLGYTDQQNYQPVYQYDSNELFTSEFPENPLGITDVSMNFIACGDYSIGYNDKKEIVWWMIDIECTNTVNEDLAISCSWADIISLDETLDNGWESVLSRNTLYSIDSWDNSILIHMPDDASIEGKQYITIDNIIISFDLIYRGNYSTGLGWDISNTCITVKSTNNEAINMMDNPSATLNIHSTPNIIDVECTGSWNDEAGFGLNIYGEMVYWVLEIEIDSAIDIFNLENYTVYCSWQDNPITCVNWKGEQYSNGGWEDVNCGATLWSAHTMAEPLTYYVEIVLPDDEAIAGKQFITINNQKVSFYLEYLGDYSTGIGWDVSDINISLNEE